MVNTGEDVRRLTLCLSPSAPHSHQCALSEPICPRLALREPGRVNPDDMPSRQQNLMLSVASHSQLLLESSGSSQAV